MQSMNVKAQLCRNSNPSVKVDATFTLELWVACFQWEKSSSKTRYCQNVPVE